MEFMAKNMADQDRLMLPAASWPTVKRIIRAYGATSGAEPSGEEVAQLGGLQRTVISGCNKFLRSTGIVQADKNKLTEVGQQLATAWSIDNQPMALEALQKIVTYTPQLAQFINTVRARGHMETDLLKGQIIVAAGLKEDSFLLSYVKTILDMLDESRLIQITEDTVTPGRAATTAHSSAPPARERQGAEAGQPPQMHGQAGGVQIENQRDDRGSRTPIPLGPNRLAYLELPENWDDKELPKLLKIVALIFGADAE